MYRLIDDIGRDRLLYPPPAPTSPAVLSIDLPDYARGSGLALGRYYAIFADSEDELAELEAFIHQSREGPVRPDLFDHRPPQIRASEIALIRYDPQAGGWPWLSVCRWPEELAREGRVPSAEMARGCYTLEAFSDVEELEAHQSEVLSSLQRSRPISVRLIAGEPLPAAGCA